MMDETKQAEVIEGMTAAMDRADAEAKDEPSAEQLAAIKDTIAEHLPEMPRPIAQRLFARAKAWHERHGRMPSHWLMSRRIARQVIAELRPLLVAEEDGAPLDDREIPPEQLTTLFGVAVELVEDLPQGAVLR